MPGRSGGVAFNRPNLVGGELENIRRAIEGEHTSGDGPFTHSCAELLQEVLGVRQVMLTTSCTDALEMCALLLDVGPGDEVVVPSYSFVSTANAFVLRGARPVFADIRPDTLNLDESRLESLITSRTKAIVALHYAGVGCEMDEVMEIAGRHGVPVVEDNAHGLFGRYRGRYLGTLGCLAAQSFHETKNVTCGEGGALLLNDPRFEHRAEIIRDKGTNRQQLFRGEVDKYTWVDLGSSFALSDILAAFLLAQLEQYEEIFRKRRIRWERYDEALRGGVESYGIRCPEVPAHCEQTHHMYYLLLPSTEMRGAFIAALNAQDIGCVFHYMPLHLSAMGRRCGGAEGKCPVTESVAGRLVRLPLYNDLAPEDQDRVIEEIDRFLRGQGRSS